MDMAAWYAWMRCEHEKATVSVGTITYDFSYVLVHHFLAQSLKLITLAGFMAKLLHAFAPRDGAKGVLVVFAKEAC